MRFHTTREEKQRRGRALGRGQRERCRQRWVGRAAGLPVTLQHGAPLGAARLVLHCPNRSCTLKAAGSPLSRSPWAAPEPGCSDCKAGRLEEAPKIFSLPISLQSLLQLQHCPSTPKPLLFEHGSFLLLIVKGNPLSLRA